MAYCIASHYVAVSENALDFLFALDCSIIFSLALQASNSMFLLGTKNGGFGCPPPPKFKCPKHS